jgi:hypothetical protein
MDTSRRSLLRRTGGLAATGLAGCLGTESEPSETATGTATRTDTGTVQRSAVPKWTKWTPSPDALGLDGYAALSFEPSGISTYSDTLPAAVTEGLDEEAGISGLGTLADQERVLLIANAVFGFVGDHDTDRLRTSFEDRGLARQRTVGGLDIYAFDRDDRQEAIGVGSGVFFSAVTGYSDVTVDPVDALAAAARDGNRLPAAVPDVKTALALTAPGESLAVRAPGDDRALVDGAQAEGFSLRLGDDQSTVTAAFVGDEVESGAVQSWADESSSFASASPAVTTDGSAVVATGAVPTGEVAGLEPDWTTESSPDVPQVQWRATYDGAAGLLTIQHRGGDTIDASDLYVRGSGFADASGADQTSPGPWQGETSDDGGIVAGSSVTVGVTSAYEVRLAYEFPDSDDSVTLFQTTA